MTIARKLFAALAALMILSPTTYAARAAPGKVAARDWTHVVTVTPAGAYVLGNPAARLKLIEYVSLTCPHCGHFALEGLPQLKARYIQPGLASLEIRHAMRDPADLTASLLARCAGPHGFFPVVDAIFAGQEEWLTKAAAYQEANGQALAAMPRRDAVQALAEHSGLIALLAPRGITPARAKACLADTKTEKLLADMTNEAFGTRKIEGTPSFVLNGALLADTFGWEALEPKLQAALK